MFYYPFVNTEMLNQCHRIGNEIGADPEVILATSHGRRTIDVLKLLCPEKANWECTFTFLNSFTILVLSLNEVSTTSIDQGSVTI